MSNNILSSTSIFGWLSVLCTFIYKLPQIYRLYKTKETEALSIYSLLIQTSSYVFYILHGITINDNPVLFMGIVSLIQNIIICILYFIYSSDKNKVRNSKNIVITID